MSTTANSLVTHIFNLYYKNKLKFLTCCDVDL